MATFFPHLSSPLRLSDGFGRLFREGLLKAAMTTGAWLLTSGIDSGVVRQVATGLDEAGISARMRSKVVTIGVAPWGLVKKRERLVGKDTKVPYEHYSLSSRNKHAILNDRHSYFLLVDNGTVGRYFVRICVTKNLAIVLDMAPILCYVNDLKSTLPLKKPSNAAQSGYRSFVLFLKAVSVPSIPFYNTLPGRHSYKLDKNLQKKSQKMCHVFWTFCNCFF